MALSFNAKKRLVIGSFATAAALWSGFTAAIPVAGPVLADTAGLTALTASMAYTISILYGKKADTATLAAFSAVALGFILGNLLLKVGASLIPIFGSYYNAGSTFVLHAATGWALCEIYDSGKDPSDFSKQELKELMKKNRRKAEEEKESWERAMDKLPSSDRSRIKNLMKQLKEKSLSDDKKTEIVKEISDIFDKNGVDYIFED